MWEGEGGWAGDGGGGRSTWRMTARTSCTAISACRRRRRRRAAAEAAARFTAVHAAALSRSRSPRRDPAKEVADALFCKASSSLPPKLTRPALANLPHAGLPGPHRREELEPVLLSAPAGIARHSTPDSLCHR